MKVDDYKPNTISSDEYGYGLSSDVRREEAYSPIPNSQRGCPRVLVTAREMTSVEMIDPPGNQRIHVLSVLCQEFLVPSTLLLCAMFLLGA
jgi:hypothetical protein